MLWPYIPLTIEYMQVLRYLGVLEKAKVDERLSKIIQQCITQGKLLVKPAAVFSRVSVKELPVPENLLKNCLFTSVVAVTVGENIERETSRLFQQGETTQGVIMDAVATVAVEEVASRVLTILSSQQRIEGLFPTPMFAPGNENLAIDYLPVLLRLAGGKQIGIGLNDYLQMTPVKSLCFLVGWTSTSCKPQNKCNLCNKKNCQFRRVRTEGEKHVVI